MKTCSRCKQSKSTDCFSVKNRTSGLLNAWCRECNKEYNREHYKNNKEKYISKAKAYKLSKGSAQAYRHGLTAEVLDAMIGRYQGKCWICKKRDGVVVDHDHFCCNTKDGSCGKCVRGILCRPCNTAIAILGDDEVGITNALDYIIQGPFV